MLETLLNLFNIIKIKTSIEDKTNIRNNRHVDNINENNMLTYIP